MSESALTPHTAPRSLEGLLKETPFKLRLLVGALKGLESEQQKMAWHGLQTNEARAQHALTLLQQWDAANPGAAQPAAQTNGVHTPPQAPPQAPPPTTSFQAPQTSFTAPMQPVAPGMVAPGAPAAVAPQAAAQAQAAAGENKTTSKRQPRTGGAEAGGADLGAQVVSMLQTILNGLAAEAQQRIEFQKTVTSILEEASTGKTSRVEALEAKNIEITESLRHISGALQSQSQLQIWTLMAFLTLAEQQTGASTTEILGAAIQDSAMFQQLVDKALGKA